MTEKTTFMRLLPEAGYAVPRSDQVRVVVTDYDCYAEDPHPMAGFVTRVVLATVLREPEFGASSVPRVELEGFSAPFQVLPVGEMPLQRARSLLNLSCVSECGARIHPDDRDRLKLLRLRPHVRGESA